MPEISLPKLLTPQQVAEWLQVDEGLIYRLLRERKLPGIKIGKRGQWRIREDRLATWLQAQEAETAEDRHTEGVA